MNLWAFPKYADFFATPLKIYYKINWDECLRIHKSFQQVTLARAVVVKNWVRKSAAFGLVIYSSMLLLLPAADWRKTNIICKFFRALPVFLPHVTYNIFQFCSLSRREHCCLNGWLTPWDISGKRAGADSESGLSIKSTHLLYSLHTLYYTVEQFLSWWNVIKVFFLTILQIFKCSHKNLS